MKRTYYMVEIDSYNQPTNDIIEVELTSKEYKKLKNTYVYIFKNWYDAKNYIDWFMSN